MRSISSWPRTVVVFFAGLLAGVLLVLAVLAILQRQLRSAVKARRAQFESHQTLGLQPPWLPLSTSLSGLDSSWKFHSLQGPATPTTLVQLRGKTIFLHSWATWCFPCVAEMPTIEALYQSVPHDKVAFLLVSTETEPVVRAYLQRRAWSLPFYLAPAPLPSLFSSSPLPTTFIIDGTGRLVERHAGAANWNDLSVVQFMRALSQGRN